jgi:hypothetical protein
MPTATGSWLFSGMQWSQEPSLLMVPQGACDCYATDYIQSLTACRFLTAFFPRTQRVEQHHLAQAKKQARLQEAIAKRAAESQQEPAPAAADAQPLYTDRDIPKVAGHFMRLLKPHQVRL